MSNPAKDFDLTHWKEVCYAHEVELEWLRAENARLRAIITDMALSDLAEMDADLLDIEPEVKP